MAEHFIRYDKNHILSATRIRKYETKLGEVVHCDAKSQLEMAIASTPARYILFGIPEDIGIKANFGKGGADTAWPSFLDAFLNIQSNDFLSGEEIFIAGHFDFSESEKLINVNAATDDEKVRAYRSLVGNIDDAVEEVVKTISQHNKIPIIIGGGHNNAYPAIKGSAKGLYKAERIPLAQINCINLDAHTDYRPAEGRHSGNAFRYADEDGYLNKYCMLGIHENYLQQNVWIDIVNNPFLDFISFEDIFVREKRTFREAVSHAVSFTSDNFTGIELDIDAIQNALSSAVSPSGVQLAHARQYIHFAASTANIAYLHICEGAVKLDNGQSDSSVGKLICYLVSDFVKAAHPDNKLV